MFKVQHQVSGARGELAEWFYVAISAYVCAVYDFLAEVT